MLKFKIIIVILLFFIFPHVSSAAVLLDRVVAIVNKEVITWSELYRMMEFEATEQVKALKEEERIKVFRINEAQFLERLIDMRLQIQEAKKIGLSVGPEEVTEAIENIKKKYSMTDAHFKESLNKEGLTFEVYKKMLSEQILISKVVNQQIRNKIVVSDDEIKKYIEVHKEALSDSESYSIRQIFFKKPKDDEAKKNLEEKGLLIIQRLKAGEDFSALAKEYSEDPSGKQGGRLGVIKKTHLAKEFREMLSHMKEGDFSIPFWTEKGLHIIKLDEKISAQNIDEVKERARMQLVEDQFLNVYKSWIKGLRERSYIEINL